METKFVFQFTPSDDSLLPQISRILEARTERYSRIRLPKIWKLVDRLNSKETAPEHVLKARRKRKLFLGLINWVLGMFLLLPGLMEPADMAVVLIAGACVLGAGVAALWRYQKVVLAGLSLLSGSILTFGATLNPDELGCFLFLGAVSLVIGVLALFRRKGKKTSFDKEAKKLLAGRKDAVTAQVSFSEDGLDISGQRVIPYQDIDAVFETEDLIAPVFQNQIILLKKKDLQNDPELFRAFLMEHTELVQA